MWVHVLILSMTLIFMRRVKGCNHFVKQLIFYDLDKEHRQTLFSIHCIGKIMTQLWEYISLNSHVINQANNNIGGALEKTPIN